jgi:hypothetical protein
MEILLLHAQPSHPSPNSSSPALVSENAFTPSSVTKSKQIRLTWTVPIRASSAIEAKSRQIPTEAYRSTEPGADEQMSQRSNETILVFISTESDKLNGQLQGLNPQRGTA